MITTRRWTRPWIVIMTALVVLAAVAVVVMTVTLDDRSDETSTPSAAAASERHGGDDSGRDRPPTETSNSNVPAGPTTHDPAELGRWLAGVVYGIDHRDDRDSYADAIWAASIGVTAENPDAAREAFADHPALAGILELVPTQDVWDRMAVHEQWSTFEVREPIGTEPVDIGDAPDSAGLSVTRVLVTGVQTIHYVGGDGSDQTHSERPSLEVLIGCADEFGGCRLLSVDNY